MSKDVVIIGGGMAGLTAATLLRRSGFHVTLLEASAELGGLAKSKMLPDGYPTEHSLRVYRRIYTCLFDILKTIPFNEKETVLQQLVPVSLALNYQNDIYLHQQTKNIFKKFIAKYQLIQFLIKHGFQLKDFFQLLKEEIYTRLSWQRITKKIGNTPIDKFLEKRSPSYIKIMFTCYKIAFLATKNTSALLAVELDTDCNPFTFFWMANGPTSERIINPWEKYLLSLGVNIKKCSQVVSAQYHNEKISKVMLSTGEELKGDVFICATPYQNMIQIMRSSPELLNKFSIQNEIDEDTEWTNGAQFYLSDLPKAPLFQPGILYAHLSSPWKLVTIVQGKGFWENYTFPEGCQYCLSATFTSSHEKGILYNKTLLECTKEEIINEMIAQCHLDEKNLIIKHYLDDSIVFMSDADYLKKRDELTAHLAYQNKQGDWILNFSSYIVSKSDNILSSPDTKTSIANLYLAGDYCKTAMLIATMEKACESGYRAAEAISRDHAAKTKISLPFTSYNTKNHRLCRCMDAILFKVQRLFGII